MKFEKSPSYTGMEAQLRTVLRKRLFRISKEEQVLGVRHQTSDFEVSLLSEISQELRQKKNFGRFFQSPDKVGSGGTEILASNTTTIRLDFLLIVSKLVGVAIRGFTFTFLLIGRSLSKTSLNVATVAFKSSVGIASFPVLFLFWNLRVAISDINMMEGRHCFDKRKEYTMY
uniref:Uncharacterized protein n=1 Tax=Megaselia scalaris TaxID=36166 RepID=T1GCE3_MEGSC